MREGVLYVEPRQLFYLARLADDSGDLTFEIRRSTESRTSRVVHWRMTMILESSPLRGELEIVVARRRHVVDYGPSGRVPVKFIPE